MNYPDNKRGVEINRLIEFLTLMIDDKLGMPTNKIESTRILNRIFRVNMTELSGNPIYQQNPMTRINETFFSRELQVDSGTGSNLLYIVHVVLSPLNLSSGIVGAITKKLLPFKVSCFTDTQYRKAIIT